MREVLVALVVHNYLCTLCGYTLVLHGLQLVCLRARDAEERATIRAGWAALVYVLHAPVLAIHLLLRQPAPLMLHFVQPGDATPCAAAVAVLLDLLIAAFQHSGWLVDAPKADAVAV